MTFTEFQASKQVATRPQLEESVLVDFAEEGLIYAGGLYIVSTHGTGLEAQGKWYLLLERDEWVSDDLTELELRLYRWGLDAGNIEEVSE